MTHRSRAWIRRRLRSLCLLELVNIPLQAVIWFGVLGLPVTAANAVGFALFALLLVEGAAYWAAKLRGLSAPGSPLPGAAGFASLRVANVPLLGAGLGFTGLAVAVEPSSATWPGLGFALFAALEYVNYFHVQLMHDTAEDLRRLVAHGPRRSHLARDLDAAKRAARAGVQKSA